MKEMISKKVKVKVPSRVHIDVMDIQKMHMGNFGGGGIGIDMSSYVTVKIIDAGNDIIISPKEKLIKYVLETMRRELNTNMKFKVMLKLDKRMKEHGGFGSNATIQLGVAYAVNYLFDFRLSNEQLIELFQTNYVEQEGNNLKKDVYCSGVAHNTVANGGLCFINDKGKLIYSKKMDKKFKIGIIKMTYDNLPLEDSIDMDDYIVNLRKQNDERKDFLKKDSTIKYEIIPSLKRNNYKLFIKNMNTFSSLDDSHILTTMVKINNMTYNDFRKKIDSVEDTIVRISSNSPYLYILSSNIGKIKKICKENDINMSIYKVNNTGINVTKGGIKCIMEKLFSSLVCLLLEKHIIKTY